MKKYNTILELICAVAGWQGGTIHQATNYFKSLTLTEQTAIYFACVENNLQNSPSFARIENTVMLGNIERFNGMVALCGTR
jgi:hypothetical protein